ncbi:NfeD family protein [Natronomonas sp. EA1]|uniref:NfeD family protein n=1 Tax=Natronomonas sp. EA1 TaxID=3421655 RepID=UPI003EC0E5E9
MVEVLGMPLSLLLLAAGSALVVAEALAPGAHFIVIGVALLVAGAVGLLVGDLLGPLTPLLLAAVVIVSGAATFHFYRRLNLVNTAPDGQTSDSESLRGKVGKVTERVTGDSGEVKLQSGGFNPYYRARSIDGAIEVGEEVIVVSPGGGNIVTVVPTNGDDEIDRELARERARETRRTDAEEDTESA